MTTNQLIDQLATDAYVHISGVAKYPATIIYKANIQQLKDICEAYHQAKCAESEPVADSDVCDTCHGTGQFCVGRSGSESDGNALEFESCPECGYAEDFGKKPCP